MSLIIIIAAICGISALLSHRRQARLAEEQKRQREAQAQIEAEQSRQRREQNEMIKRQIEADREAMRQRREIERIAREQARQAEIIRKHDERIFKLEQKLELAQREEEHQDEVVTAIRVDIAGLEAYVSYMKDKGLLCKGKEDELRKLKDKLFREETKLIKARQARELCEMQMEV